MDILELLNAERKAKAAGEPLKEQYTRIELELDTAREDEALHISGDSIAIAYFDGTATTTYFKVNHKHSRRVYPGEIEKLEAEIGGIYLTNAAEVGKKLVIYVGRYIKFVTSSSGKVKVLDPIGTNIYPATTADVNAVETAVDEVEKHFIAKTFGYAARKVQVTIDVADPVSGVIATPVSLKVAWAIIHVDAADALFGTSAVLKLANAAAGVLVKEGGDLTVEHMDLKDLWFVNEDGVVKPYIAVLYAEEA